jgi:RIO kinase 2
VSSAQKAALTLTDLDNREFRILHALEIGMIRHEFVPIKNLIKYTEFNATELNYWLKELDTKELIYRQGEPYLGYILNYVGYDCLALNALVKAEIVEALGSPLGVGKEADVFEGFTPEGNRVALKFHRLGRTSFRDTKRKREYLADHEHTSWLYQSRLAAEKEFEALNITLELGVNVPRPISHNRHVVVMGHLEGYELSDIDVMDEPEEFLQDILRNIKEAYRGGIIHSDLSEFNIFITKDGEVYLIDWPQYITKDHPNAKEILKRDITNILFYFRKKFGIQKSPEDVLHRLVI